MADVVMMGVMLGLGRVGGGSGWRQCQATEVGSREEGEGEAAMGRAKRQAQGHTRGGAGPVGPSFLPARGFLVKPRKYY